MSKHLSILIAVLLFPLTASASETKQTESETTRPRVEEAPAKPPAVCPRDIGSRIRFSSDRICKEQKPFRSYSSKELEQTGQGTLYEALRRLDPMFF